jgi:hypothetical protein
LQWGLEKKRVQRISVDVIEAVIGGVIGLAECPRVVPLKCERTCFPISVEEPRADIANDGEVVLICGREVGWTPVWAALDDVGD